MPAKNTLENKIETYIKKFNLDILKLDLYKEIFLFYKEWLRKNYKKQTEVLNVMKIIKDMETYPNDKISLFDRIKTYCKFSPYARTYEKTIARYGQIEGTKRWENYKNKQSETNTFEYKQKNFGWTREQFDEYNASRATTKENLIKRHGEEKGLEKWNAYCQRQSYAGIKLEYFIETYGEEIGIEKYRTMLQKKASSILKFAYGVSSLELEIIEEIFNYLGLDFHYNKITDYQYKLFENNYIVFYDLLIPNTNIFIEINGDYWHCNPTIYKNPNEIVRNHPVSYFWQRDDKKIKFANSKGFLVYTIWESDWKKNKNNILKNLKNYINLKYTKNFSTLDLAKINEL